MRKKRNPYRLFERVTNIVAWVILWTIFGAGMAALIFGLFKELGWWALLLLVALPVAVVVMGLLVGASVWIKGKWDRLKYGWDRENEGN